MRETTIAERYARALLDIGIEKKNAQQLQDELVRIQRLFHNSEDLRRLFSNPNFNNEIRKNVLAELLERSVISPTCRNFSLLLVDKKRIRSLDSIIDNYRRLLDQHVGRVRAQVTVARKLNSMEESRLSKALKNTLKKEVILEQVEDSSIIGGVITHVDGRVFDASLKNQLNALGARLRNSSTL